MNNIFSKLNGNKKNGSNRQGSISMQNMGIENFATSNDKSNRDAKEYEIPDDFHQSLDEDNDFDLQSVEDLDNKDSFEAEILKLNREKISNFDMLKRKLKNKLDDDFVTDNPKEYYQEANVDTNYKEDSFEEEQSYTPEPSEYDTMPEKVNKTANWSKETLFDKLKKLDSYDDFMEQFDSPDFDSPDNDDHIKRFGEYDFDEEPDMQDFVEDFDDGHATEQFVTDNNLDNAFTDSKNDFLSKINKKESEDISSDSFSDYISAEQLEDASSTGLILGTYNNLDSAGILDTDTDIFDNANKDVLPINSESFKYLNTIAMGNGPNNLTYNNMDDEYQQVQKDNSHLNKNLAPNNSDSYLDDPLELPDNLHSEVLTLDGNEDLQSNLLYEAEDEINILNDAIDEVDIADHVDAEDDVQTNYNGSEEDNPETDYDDIENKDAINDLESFLNENFDNDEINNEEQFNNYEEIIEEEIIEEEHKEEFTEEENIENIQDEPNSELENFDLDNEIYTQDEHVDKDYDDVVSGVDTDNIENNNDDTIEPVTKKNEEPSVNDKDNTTNVEFPKISLDKNKAYKKYEIEYSEYSDVAPEPPENVIDKNIVDDSTNIVDEPTNVIDKNKIENAENVVNYGEDYDDINQYQNIQPYNNTVNLVYNPKKNNNENTTDDTKKSDDENILDLEDYYDDTELGEEMSFIEFYCKDKGYRFYKKNSDLINFLSKKDKYYRKFKISEEDVFFLNYSISKVIFEDSVNLIKKKQTKMAVKLLREICYHSSDVNISNQSFKILKSLLVNLSEKELCKMIAKMHEKEQLLLFLIYDF